MQEKTKKQLVDREAVKTLAIAIGVREAARKLGLKESTVKSWSTRDKWFIQPKLPPTMIGAASNASIAPSAALAHTLNERKSNSKLHLSKYVEDATKNASESEGDLRIAPRVKDVAAIHQVLWPERELQGSGVLAPLTVYSGQTVIQVGRGHQDES